MAAMFKLTLLMILTAVCFLPQDGVDAIQCSCEGKGLPPVPACTGPVGNKTQDCGNSKCLVIEYPTASDNLKRCSIKPEDEVKCGLSIKDATKEAGESCVCDIDLCNFNRATAGSTLKGTFPPNPLKPSSSGRLHGWSSSVLNGISVLILVIGVPFLGRP